MAAPKKWTLTLARPEEHPHGLRIHTEYDTDLSPEDAGDAMVQLSQLILRVVDDIVSSTDAQPEFVKFSTADGQNYDSRLGGFISQVGEG